MTPNANAQRDQEKAMLRDQRWVYQGQIIALQVNTYHNEGKTKITEIVHHPGAVVIVPIDAKNRILLVQQWRRAAQEITIELPAGTLEENEEPKSCAARELQEETGFRSRTLTPLGGFFSAPGFCNEYLHLFAAEHLEKAPLPPDEDEGIDLLTVSLEESLKMIEENQIRDAKTVAGILRYRLWKKL